MTDAAKQQEQETPQTAQPEEQPEGDAARSQSPDENLASQSEADAHDEASTAPDKPAEEQPHAADAEPETGGADDESDGDESDGDESDGDESDGDESDDEVLGEEGSGEEASISDEPIELIEEPSDDENIEMQWYILKVASNRENSIADALRRKIKVEGLEPHFGEIVVPTEDVAEYKSGKKKIVKRKLYPGYICVHMNINDDTWFAVRETPGIGDFTGAAGRPTPMLPHEVERILPKQEDPDAPDKVKIGIPFNVEDRVRIKEGTFENFEGEVESIDEANGRVTVVINIFDRPTPVEINHWQLESI